MHFRGVLFRELWYNRYMIRKEENLMKSEIVQYPFKYGELKIIAQQLAQQVKEDHKFRIDRDSHTTYGESMTYDKAKRLLALIEEQENRR